MPGGAKQTREMLIKQKQNMELGKLEKLTLVTTTLEPLQFIFMM